MHSCTHDSFRFTLLTACSCHSLMFVCVLCFIHSGKLQLIGATTISEYRQHIESDAALERRLQPLMVKVSILSTLQLPSDVIEKVVL